MFFENINQLLKQPIDFAKVYCYKVRPIIQRLIKSTSVYLFNVFFWQANKYHVKSLKYCLKMGYKNVMPQKRHLSVLGSLKHNFFCFL